MSIMNSQEEYCYPLGYYCTVYQAEIYAMLAYTQLQNAQRVRHICNHMLW